MTHPSTHWRTYRYHLDPVVFQQMIPPDLPRAQSYFWLDAIPGVKAYTDATIVAPENAAMLVEIKLQRAGIAYERTVKGPEPCVSEEEIREKIKRFLRPIALDCWDHTDYQREGVLFGCNRPGLQFIWPTGCLAGSTGVVVNRGGAARAMTLRDLVHKWNGGESRGRKWDLAVPTMTQSVDDEGVMRLNEIVAAVYAGEKETITATVGGHQIRATGDHKFLTRDDGYRPLHELREGTWVGLIRKSAARVGWAQIQTLKDYGVESTYDLTMRDPMNNFVANRLVVHNSGKSLGALFWLLYEQKGRITKKLVTCPARAKGTLLREFRKFSDLPVEVLDGETPRMPANDTVIAIIGYETMLYWVKHLSNWNYEAIVFDEFHTLQSSERWSAKVDKNDPDGKVSFDAKKNRAQAALQLRKVAKRALGLSATPIPNVPHNLWAPLDLIEPWGYGTFRPFTATYCGGRQTPFGWDAGGKGRPTNEEEFRFRLEHTQHIVHYSRTHGELPPKRREVHYLREEVDLCEEYASFRKEAAKEKDPERRIEVEFAIAASKKRKWIVGRLAEYAPEGRKIIVLTGRKKDADKMGAESLKKIKNSFDVMKWRARMSELRYTIQHGDEPARDKAIEELYAVDVTKDFPIWLAHGDHTGEQRDRVVDEYNASPKGAIIGTTDAFGESYNLQTTDIMIFAQLPWTPAKVIQAEGRAWRRGMTRGSVLYLYPIACGTYDDFIAARLIAKLAPIERIVGDQQILALAGELLPSHDDIMTQLKQKLATEIAKAAEDPDLSIDGDDD